MLFSNVSNLKRMLLNDMFLSVLSSVLASRQTLTNVSSRLNAFPGVLHTLVKILKRHFAKIQTYIYFGRFLSHGFRVLVTFHLLLITQLIFPLGIYEHNPCKD